MPSTGVAEGQGITLTFGTSSLTVNIVDVNQSGITRQDVNTSDQATTGLETYIPSTLAEGGDFNFKVNWNLSDHAALYTAATSASAETITITYPKNNSGNAIAADDEFTGYINMINKTGQKGSVIEGNIKIKVADDITVTDEAAS